MSEVEQTTVELEDASNSFVGRWNRLISTTNWEKGRIIVHWRDAMIKDGQEQSLITDEVWAQRVGGVTGQHVGRLRRVFERFGDVHEQFEGLYWSHFQAALDWDDAEMWLEGAVQSLWSVARMRGARSETLGTVESTLAGETTSTMAEFDENLAAGIDNVLSSSLTESNTEVRPADSNPPSDEETDGESKGLTSRPREGSAMPAAESTTSAEATVNSPKGARPFEDLAHLPEDVVEAFESFKLAILRHKSDTWRGVSASDMLATLDALKELVVAPTGDGAV